MTPPTIDKRVKLSEVIELTGLSRFQILRSMEQGDFPPCWQPSERMRFWARDMVEAYMSDCQFVPDSDRVRDAAAARDELYQVKAELEQVQLDIDRKKEELIRLSDLTPQDIAKHVREGSGPARVLESESGSEKKSGKKKGKDKGWLEEARAYRESLGYKSYAETVTKTV